jgi:hypothetical protein
LRFDVQFKDHLFFVLTNKEKIEIRTENKRSDMKEQNKEQKT